MIFTQPRQFGTRWAYLLQDSNGHLIILSEFLIDVLFTDLETRGQWCIFKGKDKVELGIQEGKILKWEYMDGQCPMTDFYFIVFGAENICQDMYV